MKTSYLVLAIGIILPLGSVSVSNAVEGDTLWTRQYGGEWFEMAHSITPTTDGGCVLAGYTEYEYAGPQNMYAVRVSSLGDTLWTGEYGGDLFERAYAICPAIDGGYTLVGHTNAFGPWSDMDLVKINSIGEQQFSQHYGGDMYETAYSVCPAGDGFLLAGESGSFTAGGFYLVKVNSFGGTIWAQAYGNDVACAYAAIPAVSDGFMIVGETARYGYYNNDFYLLRVDENGNTLGSFMFGGEEPDFATSVCPSGDGGYMVAGYTGSYGAGSWDMILIKVDDNCDTLWTRTYGTNLGEQAYGICATADGGFLLAGMTGATTSGYPDMYLVKVDGDGDTLWTRKYGTEGEDQATCICIANDGSILLAGYSQPAIGEFFDMYLVKIDGSPTPVVPEKSPSVPDEFTFYAPHPNPFNPSTNLTFTLQQPAKVSLEVFDINGRCVGVQHVESLQEAWYSSGTHTIPFDGSNLPSGIYIARLTAGDYAVVQKLVLLK
jgi:hypothetical protein